MLVSSNGKNIYRQIVCDVMSRVPIHGILVDSVKLNIRWCILKLAVLGCYLHVLLLQRSE
jgi:hypothetical protein